MSFLICDAIGLVGGLLWEKFSDHIANDVLKGDLTDEKCRDLIATELHDIKTKLDGLARKDLLSSVSFLEEGLCLLNNSIYKPSNDETPFSKGKKADDSIFNNAWPFMLSEAAIDLKITSKDRFESAKRFFQQSNTRATEAFSNEALSVEDRILATKLRVISRILESLEDRDAAADSCKLYLTKLHDLPAIRERFSVYLGGGMKSRFSKKKRFEHVVSVTVLNLVVFNFTKTFTKIPVHLFNWPTIDLGERPYNPVLMGKTISCQLEKSGVQTAQIANIVIPKETSQSVIATISVNSKGEIIAVTKKGKSYNVIKITASEVQVLCNLRPEDAKGRGFEILSLTVDADDNIYVLTTCILFVFKETGRMKYKSQIQFLNVPGVCAICVTKDKNIFIYEEHSGLVYVCDCSGKLRYSFPLEKSTNLQVAISDANEIIATSWWMNSVYIYTEEGKLNRSFEVPEGHKAIGVAFNYVTKEVIVFSMKTFNDYYLSIYSKTGEQRQVLPCNCLSRSTTRCRAIISHLNGPVYLVCDNQVLFLQK